MPGYFVDHATKRAALGEDGCYIEFRKELQLGELADLDVALARFGEDGSPVAVHQANVTFLKAYLTGWRLTDDEGSERPFSPDAIEELRGPAMAQLMTAIVDGVRAARGLDSPAGKVPATEQEQANP